MGEKNDVILAFGMTRLPYNLRLMNVFISRLVLIDTREDRHEIYTTNERLIDRPSDELDSTLVLSVNADETLRPSHVRGTSVEHPWNLRRTSVERPSNQFCRFSKRRHRRGAKTKPRYFSLKGNCTKG
jgi:hypothetical protein